MARLDAQLQMDPRIYLLFYSNMVTILLVFVKEMKVVNSITKFLGKLLGIMYHIVDRVLVKTFWFPYYQKLSYQPEPEPEQEPEPEIPNTNIVILYIITDINLSNLSTIQRFNISNETINYFSINNESITQENLYIP